MLVLLVELGFTTAAGAHSPMSDDSDTARIKLILHKSLFCARLNKTSDCYPTIASLVMFDNSARQLSTSTGRKDSQKHYYIEDRWVSKPVPHLWTSYAVSS